MPFIRALIMVIFVFVAGCQDNGEVKVGRTQGARARADASSVKAATAKAAHEAATNKVSKTATSEASDTVTKAQVSKATEPEYLPKPFDVAYDWKLPQEAVARLGAAPFWDFKDTTVLRLSPDGKSVAVGTVKGKLRVFDPFIEKDLFCLNNELRIWSMEFSSDSKLLAIGMGQIFIPGAPKETKFYVRVFDAQSGQLQHSFSGMSGSPDWLAFSPSGKHIVVSSPSSKRYKELRCFSLDKNEQVWSDLGKGGGLGSKIIFPHFTPDGKFLLDVRHHVMSAECSIEYRDPENGKVLKTLAKHKKKISLFLLTPDGSKFVTCDDDAKMRTFETSSAKMLAEFSKSKYYQSRGTISSDGKWLITGTRQPELWDLVEGKHVTTLSERHSMLSGALLKDGKSLIFADRYEKLRWLAVPSGKSLLAKKRFSDAPADAALLSKDRVLLTFGSKGDGYIWSIKEKRVVQELPQSFHASGWTEVINGGSSFLRVAKNNQLVKCDSESFKVTKKYPYELKEREYFRFFDRGANTLISQHVFTGELTFLSLASGKVIRKVKPQCKYFEIMDYNKENEQVLIREGYTKLLTISARDGKTLWDSQACVKSLNSGRFFKNGKEVIAASYSDCIYVISTEQDKVLRKLSLPKDSRPFSLNLLANGKFILACCNDKKMRLIDSASGQTVRTFEDGGRTIRFPIFSLDGQWMVTDSSGKGVLVWDMKSLLP